MMRKEKFPFIIFHYQNYFCLTLFTLFLYGERLQKKFCEKLFLKIVSTFHKKRRLTMIGDPQQEPAQEPKPEEKKDDTTKPEEAAKAEQGACGGESSCG